MAGTLIGYKIQQQVNNVNSQSNIITDLKPDTTFLYEHKAWTQINGGYTFQYPAEYTATSNYLSTADIAGVINIESSGTCTPGTSTNSTTKIIGNHKVYYFNDNNPADSKNFVGEICNNNNSETIIATYPKTNQELAEKILKTLILN